MLRRFFEIIRNRNGQTLVIFAILLIVILAFLALVVDVSIVAIEKQKLQNAVDASILAAAQELPDTEAATNYANEYMELNGYSSEDIEVTFSDTNNEIYIKGTKEISYMFAKVLGFDNSIVTITASATKDKGDIIGVRPFGIEQTELVYGELYTLKEGGGSGYYGNYGGLALGGTGADVFKDNITNGYQDTLAIGDTISTEPGNMSSCKTPVNNLIDLCTNNCTFDNFDDDCPKLITIIIVDAFDGSGRYDITIVGFAEFFLTQKIGSGHNCVMKGRFVEYKIPKYVNGKGNNFGVKLVK